MRLFYHFATHYDGHHLERIVFKKRYDDLCTEWLGGIKVLKHRYDGMFHSFWSFMGILPAATELRDEVASFLYSS